jgi:hypothetical protein
MLARTLGLWVANSNCRPIMFQRFSVVGLQLLASADGR